MFIQRGDLTLYAYQNKTEIKQKEQYMNSSHLLLLYGVQNIRTEKDTQMSILEKKKKVRDSRI